MAYFMVTLMVLEVALPLSSYALTSGPSQPEFSSFEPVSTVKMVNEFTGDFTYNLPLLEIPGPEGSSYPLSLSYHAGASPEEEASWVGFGWTLNPGAISRNTSGYPDDFNGEEVTQYNRVPSNRTTTLGGYAGNLEVFGIDALTLNANASIRYNNYTGFGYVAGLGVDKKGIGSLGYSVSDASGSFTYKINPGRILQKAFQKNSEKGDDNTPTEKATKQSLTSAIKIVKPKAKVETVSNNGAAAKRKKLNFFPMSFKSVDQRPTSVTPYIGLAFNFTMSIEPTVTPLPLGLEVGLMGSYALQKNIPEVKNNAFGFMYTGNASQNDAMDYVTEKDQMYTKKDHYLGIPHSSPDHFAVTGEMLGGGFRLHNRNTTHFRKNRIQSETFTGQLGLELMVGPNFGLGADFGLGVGVLTMDEWSDEGMKAAKDGDEPYFFRFNNDQGGYIDRGPADAQRAAIKADPGGLGPGGDPFFVPEIPANLPEEMNGGDRSQRSSYIGYHTMNEMADLNAANNRAYRLYTRRADLLDNTTFVDRNSVPGSSLGELSITNGDGVTHNFGLPVYSRNENNLRYLLTDIPGDNYLIHQQLEKSDAPYVVGQERSTPYASQFLLTEILMPDYIDRTLDGPTEDDFGGYTIFNYDQHKGSVDKSTDDAVLTSDWYKWRMPYNGLLYDRGLLSDKKDDGASISYGEKEIYYLEDIETRTHYAKFYKSVREDGFDAHHDESTATGTPSAKGSNGLLKLDKIELWRKGEGGNDELIKTVVFEYDYSAWGCGANGVPNSMEKGKLTLRRVYFEYEGTHNFQISPYEFFYNYPQLASAGAPGTTCNTDPSNLDFLPVTHALMDYPQKYDALETWYNGKQENPGYDPRGLDPWGSHQEDGYNRYNDFKPWMDQVTTSSFDPAAYQLKSITLPSGGQIHVQYEQDDYRYVQDRDAMVMVRLKDNVSIDGTNGQDHKYYLDVTQDMDLNHVGSYNLNDLADLISKRFKGTDEKIYFKFLYSLIGNSAPNLSRCSSEFIDGFVRVEDVGVDANGLWINLGGQPSANEYRFPRQVCRDFYRTQRAGAIEKNDDCSPGEAQNDDQSNIVNTIQQLLGWVGGSFGNNCKEWDPTHSYFRVPVPGAKKGGGLRVKRLLMYDKGIDQDKQLFGTEYEYNMMEDGKLISSGVATREPVSVREEDPIVNLLDRKKQTWLNRILSGKDRKQTEGPIGENLIEPASIGYRRVVAKSIHTGRTNPGYTVHEFNTCKTFPFDRKYLSIDSDPAFDKTTIEDRKFMFPTLPFGLFKAGVDNRWLSQGYRFIKYHINGQPKRIAAYMGDPAESYNPASSAMISSQEFEYFEPGESVPIMSDVDEILTNGWYPGKEMEVVMESRAIHDVNVDVSTEADASVGVFLIVPIPFLTAIPSSTYSERRLFTHVTSKVVSYPVIQKRTTSYQDGIWHQTQHLAFNPENGQPILTQTTDGYDQLSLPGYQDPNATPSAGPYVQDGRYQAYTIPASREYPELGQRATNERMFVPGNTGVTLSKDYIAGQMYLVTQTLGATDPCEALNGLSAGSRVRVYDTQNNVEDGIYTLGEPNGQMVPLLGSHKYSPNNTYTGPVSVEIVESGKTNQLGASVGGFTTYGGEQTIDVTPIPTSVLNARNAIASGLNSTLAGLSPTTPGSAMHNMPDDYCDFKFAHSDDVGIRLSVEIANIVGPTYILKVELVDWRSTAVVERCEVKIPGFAGGSFGVHPTSGELVFYSAGNTCSPFELPCLKFCHTEAEVRTLPNVVVANAMTLADEWTYSQALYGSAPAGANAYESGEKGNWRTLSNYNYRTGILHGAEDDITNPERIYRNAGVFPLELFNYDALSANDPNKWLKMNTVTKYSPYGMALEEENILGIKSAAHFGYDQTVPVAVAQNTNYDQSYFESFENRYGNTGGPYELEENVSINAVQWTNDQAHSGRASCEFTSNNSVLNLKPFTVTQEIINNGLSLQLWVRDNQYNATPITVDIYGPGTPVFLNMELQARSGEWALYEGQMEPGANWTFGGVGDVVTPRVSRFFSVSNPIQIDDVRYQPLDAQMTCYVYDVATLRLVCTFDDQHFGLYNQYNGEGQLVRKRIETERGMKTVQETQYHSVEQPRL